MSSIKRIQIKGQMSEVYISDVHFPFEDKLAWNLALRIISIINPDIIWLGGDIVDFYAISHFIKDPKRRLQLQDEIDAAYKQLKRLRNQTNAKIYYQAGNHEDRMRKHLWQRAVEFSGLRAVSIPPLLHLDELEIRWIEYGNPVEIGKLHHIHGDEVGGGFVNIARGKLLKLHCNVIFGHHHRFQSDYIRGLDGKTYGAWANGCICGLSPEWVLNAQWTNGLSLIRYNKSGLFNVDHVPFFKNGSEMQCVLDGQIVSYKDKK